MTGRGIRYPLAAFALFLSCSSASAGSISMICENPRREYRVTFNEDTRAFSADDTDYRVLAVEMTQERYVVAGLTVDQGPTFRAHFRPYQKLEWYTDNQLYQTDGCR
ncbi:hypothetical protein [Sinorhizobium meliloti]|uniref:hypothetical protein n=1 Tax=Rhizobium meliloti TaxID=382 RepID=UPI000FD7DC0D|nr:hypothetical protein [Sinorhizobium meliloti]RVO57767.1 hypothetical protein CN092_11900 [Sinorhizobium meliloti]